MKSKSHSEIMDEIVTLSVNGIVKSKSHSDIMNGIVIPLSVKKEYGKYVSFKLHDLYSYFSFSITTAKTVFFLFKLLTIQDV